MSELNNENPVLIIGGGHSGVSAALEITEAVDKKVYIVEKKIVYRRQSSPDV